jgi:hypothetical protein
MKGMLYDVVNAALPIVVVVAVPGAYVGVAVRILDHRSGWRVRLVALALLIVSGGWLLWSALHAVAGPVPADYQAAFLVLAAGTHCAAAISVAVSLVAPGSRDAGIGWARLAARPFQAALILGCLVLYFADIFVFPVGK